ncbi:hypothetical protein A1O7_05194 [Cladophialophora yegresii CBS 114405]|uniref:Xylanolytic transcriptional activator regulatory domain-containing protein n=1 Tax=Cladophialophora yegresii CBS 114405 TaxID=1182544 RepID=W9W931_9EURO|nr:uncharacterized protein A1O7_05194 [Cladophialophora yegresii CBS 114405]EXJ61041.1 hypothetical protein A1O7_05194 [Cladophialophora yegresii CBS 114405]
MVQSPTASDGIGDDVVVPPPPSNKSNLSSSFVGAHTLLVHDALKDVEVTTATQPRLTSQARSALQFVEADVLPKPPLLAALTESYFQNVFHRYPVADRAHLADPECPTLLKQAVCMAGSLMRPSSSTGGLALSQSLYEKTKMMLFFNHEQDPVTSLAALCLLICWSGNPSNSSSLDCPWQWTGTAIRLAVQMGLHKEVTYTNRPDAGRLRRLWWTLMNADRLQAACFGRPLGLRRSDYDTRMPSAADFDRADISSLVFVHYAGVIAVWGEIADVGARGFPTTGAVIEGLTDMLCNWVAELPEEICLFDQTGSRRPYRQSISELHMVYSVAIILVEALSIKRHEQWSTSLPAIIAAAFVTRLIEEVDCWDELNLMSSTTTFYAMAASIPLIYHRTSNPERRAKRQEGLLTLCSALERMSPRWGAASVLLGTIRRIRNLVEQQAAHQPQQQQQQQQPQEQEQQQEHQDSSDPAETTQSGFTPPRAYRHREMFPFPPDICPDMALLHPSIDDVLDVGDMMLPLGDEHLLWSYGESQTYLDHFRLNMFGDGPSLMDEAF